jgi:predicted GNAT family acetyltransferase
MKYTDEAYKEAIAVVVSDIHYSNASYTSKIANIRRYSEIIIRRLLGYDSDKQLTLGHHVTQDKLRKKGFTEKLITDAITSINEEGSDRTHTQVIPVATKEEYEKAISNLFDLYAYLFVDYFKRNPFGSNPDIMRAFSILPAEIRHTALLCLYELYPDNINIVDKLVLAMVKARGLEATESWIEEHKEQLELLSPEFSSKDYMELIEKHGVVIASTIAAEKSRNMYDVSREKARIIGASYVPLYATMEEALSYYNTSGIVPSSTDDANEFNDLMRFIYLGRKEDNTVAPESNT